MMARFVHAEIQRQGSEAQLLDLCTCTGPMFVQGAYGPEDQSAEIRQLQDKYLLPARALYFVVPEYNGSFPGVLKFFLDACSVREYKATFQGKKAATLGVSTGRAGNLRGMDHLTGILNYLDITVMPNRLPVSQIHGLADQDGLKDPKTRSLVQQHVTDFLQFCG